ncbi:hypothetical protein MUO14_16720 [Halobacillus shinanisalinarum]|uniref:Histidine kinase N-terminal 7TM region domain-containing protein n=1 Tax=Halobacillus shinanisalinarum TaxID=2932258 RepID=A0ABY4GVC7_9BACI|nr:hypothetical protein [Halobacillus shinanisalinarum]UOQ92125.1 hypothetical protein MUO14_16720 [Halobacillus shinanisalinarum]
MAFAVFFFASWLVLTLFLVIPKKLSIIENTFVFLIILVISINWTWIIYEEIKLIKSTEETMEYTAFLLFRSVIIPMILVTQLNLLCRANKFTKSLLILSTSLAILLLLTFLSTFFNMANYIKWNIGYDAIYYLSLHVIAYYSLKFFRKSAQSEVKYS